MARQATKKIMITGTQIRLIHTLTGALKMPDSIYRAMLFERYRVESSKDLDTMQAAELIRDLETKAIAAEVWQLKNNRAASTARPARSVKAAKKHEDLEQRRGDFATPAQLRKIEVMWSEVSRIKEPEPRRIALRHFIKRVAKVADIRFLDMKGATATINVLTAMQKTATETKRKIAAQDA